MKSETIRQKKKTKQKKTTEGFQRLLVLPMYLPECLLMMVVVTMTMMLAVMTMTMFVQQGIMESSIIGMETCPGSHPSLSTLLRALTILSPTILRVVLVMMMLMIGGKWRRKLDDAKQIQDEKIYLV